MPNVDLKWLLTCVAVDFWHKLANCTQNIFSENRAPISVDHILLYAFVTSWVGPHSQKERVGGYIEGCIPASITKSPKHFSFHFGDPIFFPSYQIQYHGNGIEFFLIIFKRKKNKKLNESLA